MQPQFIPDRLSQGRKPLNKSQAKRRERILEAAKEMVAKEGYDNLQMLRIAQEAGVSRATLYRYYPDKVHVVSDLILQWGYDLIARLKHLPAEGDNTAEKIEWALRCCIEDADTHMGLVQATLTCLISSHASSRKLVEDIRVLLPALMATAIDLSDIEDKDFVLGTINQLLLANMMLIGNGRFKVDEAMHNISRVIRLLLPETSQHKLVTATAAAGDVSDSDGATSESSGMNSAPAVTQNTATHSGTPTTTAATTATATATTTATTNATQTAPTTVVTTTTADID